MNPYLVFLIGIAAQILFSGRLLVQWIASERAKKVLSPTLFWQMSMAASFMLCVYGWLRNDFAIIAGQLISYYILHLEPARKKAWDTMPAVLRAVVSYLPVVAVCWFAIDWRETAEHLFRQENIPGWLIVFGTVGQFTFTLRFIYQWRYSARAGESLLPTTFWLISLLGSGMIIAYAIIRRDPVLILGQSTGFVVYLRNIMISRKAARSESAR